MIRFLEPLLIQNNKIVELFKDIFIISPALVLYAMTELKLDYIIQKVMEVELTELLFILWVVAGALGLTIHQFLITVTCVLLQMQGQHLQQFQTLGSTL